MRKLRLDTMTIEHFSPRSISDDASTIDYCNLLGVCPGNRAHDKKFQTCDAHRGNSPLTINPLRREFIQLIQYQSNGIISSENDTIRHDLQETLNLNCTQVYLPENRKAALSVLQAKIHKDLRNHSAGKSYFQRLYDELSKGKNGLRQEYSGILLAYLEKRGAVPPPN
jgi:hypothetical protein